MSEKTFSYLLDYYIACLNQEDLLSVTFNVSSENISFLSTLFQTEVLFHTNNTQARVKNTEGAKKFFQTSLLRQKNTTLYYGYPVITGPLGTLSPLFFTEITNEQKDEFIILSKPTTDISLNHHILTRHGFSVEEIKNIQQQIKGEPFQTALESLCDLLQLPYHHCTPALDTTPIKHTITYTLLNKALVYFAERTDITANLIQELIQLKKKPLDELSSTALLLLLTNQYPLPKTQKDNQPLLEIFPINPAQKHAISHALNHPLTVITGPPGTGKSQVVLNIIANAVNQNKTVLFASKNNKAVDVVIEKINTILPYKLIVRMGHQTHRRNTKTELHQLLKQHIPESSLKKTIIERLQNINRQLEQIHYQIQNLQTRNESIEKTQELLELYQKQFPEDPLIQNKKPPLDSIDPFRLQDDLGKLHKTSHILRPFSSKRYQRKIDHYFYLYYNLLPDFYKTILQNLSTNQQITKEASLHRILAWKHEEIAHNEIKTLKKELSTNPSYIDFKKKQTQLQKQYIPLSQTILQHQWLNKFRQAQINEKQEIQAYFSTSEQLETTQGSEQLYRQLHTQRARLFQRILTYLPVWVVTNLSAKQSFPLQHSLFDILIIDEASQCDIISALPLFYRAKHVVIIGDPYQLKHISRLTDTQDRLLASTHHLPAEIYAIFSYTKHSLYDYAEHIIHTQGKQPLLLNEHYRCHPEIVSFSNEFYYKQKLMIATDETTLLHHPLFPTKILWRQVKGNTIHSKSPYNEEEAEKVIEELLKLNETAFTFHASVGVVTLFRAQTELILEKLKPFKDIIDIDITIGTAHRFQGDEKDIILFSPAVSEGIKPGTLQWIQTTNQLLNVAVTRARSLFIIIGDQQKCRQTTGPLRNLSDYVDSLTTQSLNTDAQIKKTLFTAARNNDIPLLPWISSKTNNTTQVDYVYFVNGKRYAIILEDTHHAFNKKQLQNEGWKIRTFSNNDIQNNLQETLEELKRLC